MSSFDIHDLFLIEEMVYADVSDLCPSFNLSFQSYASWSGWDQANDGDVVCHLFSSSFPLNLHRGFESALVLVADRMTDVIMTEIVGGPWPVVTTRFAGQQTVLSASITSSGSAAWQSTDWLISVPIGKLRTSSLVNIS